MGRVRRWRQEIMVSPGGVPVFVSPAPGSGYWLVGSDGGVFNLGDAGYFGSLPGIGVHVNNIVGTMATP